MPKVLERADAEFEGTVTMSKTLSGHRVLIESVTADDTLTAAESGALDAERYVYDLEITSDVGAVTRVIEGLITVRPQVTT